MFICLNSFQSSLENTITFITRGQFQTTPISLLVRITRLLQDNFFVLFLESQDHLLGICSSSYNVYGRDQLRVNKRELFHIVRLCDCHINTWLYRKSRKRRQKYLLLAKTWPFRVWWTSHICSDSAYLWSAEFLFLPRLRTWRSCSSRRYRSPDLLGPMFLRVYPFQGWYLYAVFSFCILNTYVNSPWSQPWDVVRH